MNKQTRLLRQGTVERKTRETNISLSIQLDEDGDSNITTGIRFLDHMLGSLAKHARIQMNLTAKGDLDVDDHHTVEDVALVLGMAVDQALGDRAGIARFGSAYAPLDEALSRAVIDLSGRPYSFVSLDLRRPSVGDLSCENATHFFKSFCDTARVTLHLDVLRGENDHHRIESAFKAFALAFRQSIAREGANQVPSTKGVL